MKSNIKNNRYDSEIDLKETFRSGNPNEATNATEKMNDLLKSISSVNSDNIILSHKIVKLEENRILKNSLIFQLDSELDYFVDENETLKLKAKHIEELKIKSEGYRNQAYDYCTDLNKKMKGFIDTVTNI